MSGPNPIGTINVKVGGNLPRVQTISYGQSTQLKNASDLSLVGAVDGDVIVYEQSTNSFQVTTVPEKAITNIDGGTF
jgi:hypothetical protein